MDAYDTPDDLFQYAMIPRPDEFIEDLRRKAIPEDWNYQNTVSQRPNIILYNYIKYTYRRIAEERKIAVTSDEGFSAWNTGLVTPHQEQLYIAFERNMKPTFHQYWHYWGTFHEGQYELNRFDELPAMAHYFEDPAKLVFDTRKDVRKNVKHIVVENRERFPASLHDKDPYMLEILLEGAIKSAILRTQRNYKTAIPQYHESSIQLLLPLCLESNGKADLALVVEDFGSFYRASTCLTLDMAYNNARQLARPDRDWLQP